MRNKIYINISILVYKLGELEVSKLLPEAYFFIAFWF